MTPDAFPHTRRPLPWLLAGFLVMLFLVPVGLTRLKVHLPFAASLDRLWVMIMVVAWIAFRGDQLTVWRSRRSRIYVAAVAFFVAIVVTGLLADSGVIIRMGEFSPAQKQLTALLMIVVVTWYAMTALRPEDLHGFATLLIGLGVFMGLGLIMEARSGFNVFYTVSNDLLKPIANVSSAGTQLNGVVSGSGHAEVMGPAQHGLAAASMMAMTMPFALMRVLDPTSARSKWLNLLAVTIIAAGAISTKEKTSFITLMVVFAFLAFHRPRRMLRLAPFGVVLFGVIHVMSPGSLGTVLDPTLWFHNTGSTAHRSQDLQAIWPDVMAHPLLGRGYGSIIVTQEDQFRIMDNQDLGMLWQTGILGLGSYILMALAPIFAIRHVRRCPDQDLKRVAIAASAGCIVFLVVNYLFDALSFVEVPYIFFVLGAMCTVASGAPQVEQLPAAERVRRRYGVALT